MSEPVKFRDASLFAPEYERHGLFVLDENATREKLNFIKNFFQDSNFLNSDPPTPLESRANAALIANYGVHEHSLDYGAKNLRKTLETKLQFGCSNVSIIAAEFGYYFSAFETNNFSYEFIDWIHRDVNHMEFYIFNETCSLLFIFYDDEPYCLLSASSDAEFERGFISKKEARGVFTREKYEWIIYKHPSQYEILDKIDASSWQKD